MNRFTKIRLSILFAQVPILTAYDWQSPQGREFLDAVDEAVSSGVDINEIGSLVEIHNFSQRYKILKRGRSERTELLTGDSDPSGQHEPGRLERNLPPLWRQARIEGARESGV
jgi:hypothetical protein